MREEDKRGETLEKEIPAYYGCPKGEPGEEGAPTTEGIPEEWLQRLHENIAERYPSNLLENHEETD